MTFLLSCKALIIHKRKNKCHEFPFKSTSICFAQSHPRYAFVTNTGWQILSTTAKRITEKYPCCVNPFSQLHYTMILKRKPVLQIFQIVMPCMLLYSLTLTSFWLPQDSPGKKVFGISVLSVCFVFFDADFVLAALRFTEFCICFVCMYAFQVSSYDCLLPIRLSVLVSIRLYGLPA